MRFLRGRTLALLAVAALLMVSGAQAQVSGRAFSGFAGGQSNGPISIEADDLRIDEGAGEAIYEGNVAVRRGASTVRTGKLTVKFSGGQGGGLNQNSIDRLLFGGGIVVTNADNTITADNGTFNARTEVVVLNGTVVVSQGDNVAKGCKLVANLKRNSAKLEGCGGGGGKKGRVRSVFTPGSTGN